MAGVKTRALKGLAELKTHLYKTSAGKALYDDVSRYIGNLRQSNAKLTNNLAEAQTSASAAKKVAIDAEVDRDKWKRRCELLEAEVRRLKHARQLAEYEVANLQQDLAVDGMIAVNERNARTDKQLLQRAINEIPHPPEVVYSLKDSQFHYERMLVFPLGGICKDTLNYRDIFRVGLFTVVMCNTFSSVGWVHVCTEQQHRDRHQKWFDRLIKWGRGSFIQSVGSKERIENQLKART